MADEFLKSTVKEAVRLAREGNLEGSLAKYMELFASPGFAANPPDDQRQAVKLMLKTIPSDAPASAQRAAQAAVAAMLPLVQAHHEPQDHDLCGQAQLKSGDAASARKTFEAGLAIAHARNDAHWAGELLKRVSML